MKRCPHCREEIQDEATVCKHCGRDLRFISAAFSPPWEAEAKALAFRGEVISAIKKVREGSGLGLKEAKDVVDAWRKENPSAATAKSSGCGLVVAVVILIVVAVVVWILRRS